MRIAILAHSSAAAPRSMHEVDSAASMRRALTGQLGGGCLAVEVHDPVTRRDEWHLVMPLRDGSPVQGRVMTIRQGMCPPGDAQAAYDAAVATADYHREWGRRMRALRRSIIDDR
ncbi:hypothetical protein CTJ15_04600 (plasmid) [Roseomonas sp. FDAARGOS_362]|nr:MULTISPECIES: hypothetical protein [Roseomonas]ATR19639.1 hypothetical protein CTJ15_04600 [Roseomonas sp. FDAARGOS_362]MCG7354747.1 hypothetical protein [Roseomonas mucosa]